MELLFCECGMMPRLIARNGEFGPTIWAECPGCYREGHSAGTQEEAIQRWNQDIWCLFGDTTPKVVDIVALDRKIKKTKKEQAARRREQLRG